MIKKIFLIVAIVVLVVIGCANGNEEKAIDQKTLDKVAKIAAMVEIDETKALEMLETEKMSVDKYKEIITAITLDAKATDKFVEMKKNYMEQYTK
ncbi:MAG: hypothetical protein JSV53_09905 [candidate division WOR-3 bacterium]|nr:MAG: hypothetical protein JSV53_09905 [candidate division WOR-3 bacterium]